MKKRGTAVLVVRVKKTVTYLYIAKGPSYDALISWLVNPVIAVCNNTTWKQRTVRNADIVFDRIVVMIFFIVVRYIASNQFFKVKTRSFYKSRMLENIFPQYKQ